MKQNSSTPEGFRNLRVLLPEDLHWRLRELAHQSRMTFHKYILAWLSEAVPLSEDAGPPEQRTLPNPPQAKEPGPGSLRGHATPKSPKMGEESANPKPPPPGPGRQAASTTPPNLAEKTTR